MHSFSNQMHRQLFYCQLIIGSSLSVATNSEIPNPLNGKHLRVLAMEWPVSLETVKNATGHVVGFKGTLVEYMETLSKSLNFSYSYLPQVETLAENPVTGRGAIYYLLKGEADYLLTTSLGTPYRNKVADMPTYWFIGPFGFIVPYPKETINIASTLNIFTYQVWVAIAVSVVAILFYMRFATSTFFRPSRPFVHRDNSTNTKVTRTDDSLRGITDFVLGNLVSQGQHCYSKKLAVRLAAGAWCLGCFFIVQMYSSTLTSYLMAPNQKPIANNLREIAETPGIAGLTMEIGYGVHQQLKLLDFGVYKKVSEKMKNDPNLLCNKTDICLKKVREDGNAAYTNSILSLKNIMQEDLKSTGSCHYYLLKDTFLWSPTYTFLAKNSPYTERVNIEIQRYHQAGLLKKWESNYASNPRQCLNLASRQEKQLKRISLSHLSSAFLILGVGLSLSLFVYFSEKISHQFI